MKNTKRGKRVIKGWGFLNDDGEIISVEVGQSKPNFFHVVSWTFPVGQDTQVVPVLITLQKSSKIKIKK